MAIEAATATEVQAARDEVFKAAVMLQKYVQGEPEQAGALTAVNAQMAAAKAAVDDVVAATAGV